MKNDTAEGKLLGTFTYDENGESSQTFELAVRLSWISLFLYEGRLEALVTTALTGIYEHKMGKLVRDAQEYRSCRLLCEPTEGKPDLLVK